MVYGIHKCDRLRRHQTRELIFDQPGSYVRTKDPKTTPFPNLAFAR